jgi:hypothetical protein
MTGDAEPPDSTRTEAEVGAHLTNGQAGRALAAIELAAIS